MCQIQQLPFRFLRSVLKGPWALQVPGAWSREGVLLHCVFPGTRARQRCSPWLGGGGLGFTAWVLEWKLRLRDDLPLPKKCCYAWVRRAKPIFCREQVGSTSREIYQLELQTSS